MKKFFQFLMFVFAFVIIQAQQVISDKAYILAKNFYKERLWNAHNTDVFTFNTEPVILFDNIGNPAIYIFECIDKPGYILVSADYSLYPVFGYSFESGYAQALEVPVFSDMIDEFTQQVVYARTSKILPTETILQEWEYYSNENFNKSYRNIKNLAPLLQTKWDQGCYYNELCPADAAGPCGRVWAGCVATAMGQVMKYHNWPPQGTGSHSYLSGYGNLSANFGATTYNWAQMQNSLSATTDNFEVAQLLYHCGVSVNMDYSPDGSGAQTEATANSLKQYFKYADYIVHQEKEGLSESIWAEMLRTELHSGRPVLYRGYDGSYGHAFVCDGYQGSFFHFNMGWGGYADGYYTLSNVGGFSSYQAGIFGVEPEYLGPQYCADYTLLTDPVGTISDGSLGNRYANNTNCKWLIQPPNAGAIVLNLKYLNTEPQCDRILIYEGDSEFSYLIADVSGFNVPANPIVVSGGSMFVWFLSDDRNAAKGWEADYLTWFINIDEYATGQINITPNPATDNISVEIGQKFTDDLVIVISDITGRQIIKQNQEVINGTFNMSISDIANGIYSFEIYHNTTKIANKKLVVSR